MGKPGGGDAPSSAVEYIGRGGERRELKHLSTCRKGKRSDFLSSGERKGTSPNRLRVQVRRRCAVGVVGPAVGLCGGPEELQRSWIAEPLWKVRPQKVIALYAKSMDSLLAGTQVTPVSGKPV